MAEYPLPSYKRLILPWFFSSVKGNFVAVGDFFQPFFVAMWRKNAEKGPIRMGAFLCSGLLVELFVGVVVVLGAEFPGQPLLHTAVSHAEVMPAADQQADNRCECQAGADDLQDHACSFVHNVPPVSVLWPPFFVLSYTLCRNLTTVFCREVN